ncbi:MULTISPECIES: hypothetical protein [Roseobacteraceae]|jgi:hypothetical protein|uniref:Uncharacterized protein n=1 Tax=Leisingera caerulea TaxID=506591 RepID=A0A9Q9HPD4_LEICA|nr:hypothetical protein [Leisingera caerulea]UWQ56055.1 hypothetical protein K3721_19300 [Leisingera caerulea]
MVDGILEAVMSEIDRNLSDAKYLEEQKDTLLQSGEFLAHELDEIITSCRDKAARLQEILDKRSSRGAAISPPDEGPADTN